MHNRILKLAFTGLLALMILVPSSGLARTPRSASPASAPFVPGQIIVGLDAGASIQDVAATLSAEEIQPLSGGRVFLLDVSGNAGQRAVEAAAIPGVRYAEPNWLRQLHDAPNDGNYPLKWDLNNDGSLCDGGNCASVDADMDWQEAFTLLGSTFSGSAVVAVIDTGIDPGHPDLNAKIVPGYDYLDGDADPTDTYGHGTHVAGIALAETNNGEGTSGVAYSPNIKVMPLRVCDSGGCPTSAIVDAIYHAADNGANVINLSLGGRFGSASEQQAINYAWNNGLVIAASSGNDGSGKVSYPAAFVNAIAVGSTNWHDQLAPYSNSGNDLDVVAPGGDMNAYHDPGGIYSTMPTYDVYLTTSYSYSQNYDQLQGTSMAAPQVSGLASLLFALGVTDSDGDGNTNDEIRAIIESSADDLGKSGWDRDFGWGRVNVYSAVLAVSGGGDTPPNVTITNPGDGESVLGTVEVTADASDDDVVTQVEFFVDGGSIGVDTDGTNGWSASWDTTAYSEGSHTLSATATDTAMQTGNDSVSVTVDNQPSAGVIVDTISPDTIAANNTITVTISGSGFAVGASVAFESGEGPAPTVSNVVVVDGSTISADVEVKAGGPPRNRVWDVRVTNLDGSSGVLAGDFTVTP